MIELFTEYTLIILIIITVIFSILVYRVYLKRDSNNEGKIENIYSETDNIIINSPIQSLPFDTFIADPKTFSNEIMKSAQDNLNIQVLSELGLKNLTHIKDISTSVKKIHENEIIFTLSNNGKALIKSGRAKYVKHKSGGFVPVIKKNNKFLEQFKGNKLSKGAKLAKLTSIVVNAAHVISGQDQMKKLKEVDRKLDFLIEGRKIDQFAELESIYNSAKDMIADGFSPSLNGHLIELRRKNMKLISIWRQETELKLNNVEDPINVKWLKKVFNWEKGRVRKEVNKFCEFESQMQFYDASLRLHYALCQIDNSVPYYLSTTLPEELKRFKKVKQLMDEKAGFIKNHTDVEAVETIINNMNYILSKNSLLSLNNVQDEEYELIESMDDTIIDDD